MQLKRLLSLVLAAMLAVTVFAACSSDSGTTPPADDGAATQSDGEGGDATDDAPQGDSAADAGQIVIGRINDSAYIEPNAETVGGSEIHVINQIFEGLVTNNDENTEIIPWLAESWEISDDGLTYSFKLRPGIMFSNGEPVTGEDWIWSFERARDTETSNYAFVAEDIVSIEAPSDEELIITLSQQNASFMACLCNFNMVVGSKAHWEEVGEEEYLVNPIGTGAYRLKEWRREEYILLEANPYYHEDGLPKTQEVKFQVVSDDNTRFMQLQSGQIDMAGDMPFNMVDQVAAANGLDYNVYPATQIRYVLLNTTLEPFNDEAVRQAFVMGINKQEISDVVAGEFGKPVSSIVPEAQGKFYNGSLPASNYDPEGAKAALAEAGYTDDIPFTISIISGSEIYESIAILLKSSLDQAGFNVTIEQLERAAFLDLYQTLGHQATILQWSDDILDPSSLTSWTVDHRPAEQGGTNAWYTGLVDQELYDLNAAAAREMDEATRIEMYHEIQQRIYDNANVIPLFNNGFFYAYSDKLQGLSVTPMNVYRAEQMSKAA